MTNSTYNYRILFRPLDAFFFGGEETFGNGEKQNYYAQTRPFPQQTGILGVLRHLGHKNHLGHGNIKIGESFDGECLMTENPFGYIHRLSPLFLSYHAKEGKHYYLPGPLGDADGKPFNVTNSGDGIKRFNKGRWTAIKQLPEYSAKSGWNQLLISDNPATEQPTPCKITDVVKTFDKIGITKQEDGTERKDGFYKQKMARLEKNWEFAVLAKLDKEQTAQLPHSSILPFGAEKALFHIHLEKLDSEISFEEVFPHQLWEHNFPDDVDCILLLGNARVKDSIYEHCQLSITDTLDFRSIHTPRGITEFARFYQYDDKFKKQDRLYKSGKYNLLRRGSLLYGDSKEIEKALVHPYYQTIGYNHYTILSPKK